MASAPDTSDARKVRDALYLLDLFCESPQATLINISGYAEKMNIKPNTIVKRLGEIKKRNKLNIITTTQNPDGQKSALGAGEAGTAGMKVKKERVTKAADAQTHFNPGQATAATNKDKASTKVSTHNLGPHHGLGTATVYPFNNMYVLKAQKRTFEPDADQDTIGDDTAESGTEMGKREYGANEKPCKKVKTEANPAL